MINSCRDRQIASDSHIGLPGGLTIATLRSTSTGKNEGANLCHDMAELVDVDPESNTTTKLVVGLLASWKG